MPSNISQLNADSLPVIYTISRQGGKRFHAKAERKKEDGK
jgi:hypothetical protein